MKLLYFLLSFLLCQTTFGFLNIEALRQEKEQTKGLKGSTQFRLLRQSGNTEKTLLNASTLNLYTNKKNNYIFLANYRYGTSFGQEDTREGSLHFRYTRELTERFSWEFFHQYQFNKFQDLILRVLAGTGARYQVLKGDKNSLFMGFGAFYENENIRDGIDQENPRGNIYLSHTFTQKDDFSTSSTLYYQPNTENAQDYRVSFSLGLETYFGKHFTQQLEYNLSRDTFPPLGVKRTDSSISAGIGVRY